VSCLFTQKHNAGHLEWWNVVLYGQESPGRLLVDHSEGVSYRTHGMTFVMAASGSSLSDGN
jgi:hypothetical protein